MLKTLLKMISLGTALLLSQACNGIFEGIYDDPKPKSDFGFIEYNKYRASGTIYVDASSYLQWTYLKFDRREMLVVDIDTTREYVDPEEWDLAIHRYETKTNKGAVLETAYTDLDEVAKLESMPEGTFVEDEWTRNVITIDMSGMMDGYIKYLPSFSNMELNKWLDVDTSTMPPIYTLSGRVYLYRMADGKMAALQLENYMNEKKKKGFMRVNYIYPLNLK